MVYYATGTPPVLLTEKAKQEIVRDPKKSEVETLDWNASGEKIFVCSRDGSLKVWRSDRLMEERAWTGSWTWAEAHPEDPNLFAAVSWDGKLKLGDLRASPSTPDMDFKKTKSFEKLLSCTYSVDGGLIAIVTRTDLIHIITVSTGESITIQPNCEVYGSVFDAKNNLWVGTGGTPGKIFIFDPLTGGLLNEFVGHSHAVSCLSRTNNSKLIVSGGSDALVALWDVERMGCLRTFPNSLSPVTNVGVNHDNSIVAWGSGAIGAKDGEPLISMADLNSGSPMLGINTAAPVSRVKWHPSKPVLAYSMQQGPGADINVQIFSFPVE
jgi:THO complex subunit 3